MRSRRDRSTSVSLIPAGTTVTVETKWFPPLTVDLSPSAAGGESQSLLVRVLKPKVTVALQGKSLASVAPAGEPVPNEWEKTKIGLAVIAGLAAFTLLRVLK